MAGLAQLLDSVRFTFLVVLTTILACQADVANFKGNSSEQPIRVLFVGNSILFANGGVIILVLFHALPTRHSGHPVVAFRNDSA